MKTIHKQTLKLDGTQNIKVPKVYNILSVANQNDQLCIWYVCDTRSELEEITIHIFGTGYEIWPSFDGKHLGTVLMGSFVRHVFKE